MCVAYYNRFILNVSLLTHLTHQIFNFNSIFFTQMDTRNFNTVRSAKLSKI